MDSSPETLRDEREPPVLEAIEQGNTAPIHFCCARCGGLLSEDASLNPDRPTDHQSASAIGDDGVAGAGSSGATPAADVEFNNWQWELEQDLHDVRHLIEARRVSTAAQNADHWNALAQPPTTSPTDSTAPVMSGTMMSGATPIPLPAPAAKGSPHFTWLVLSISFMALAGGGVLLGWSHFMNRTDLWSWGLIAALGGQAGLLVGLVMFLERIWRESRQAPTATTEVPQRYATVPHIVHVAHPYGMQPPHYASPYVTTTQPQMAHPHAIGPHTAITPQYPSAAGHSPTPHSDRDRRRQ